VAQMKVQQHVEQKTRV